MNTVPLDFCQRVLATRKCCKGVTECICLNARWSKVLPPKFSARKWNQPKQILISFHVGAVNGEWKYGFRNPKEPNESATMEELKKVPQLKNLRISCIHVMENHNFDGMLKHDVVDLEKLLNFVSFLSNEPLLDFPVNYSISAEWETVFKWLSQRWFSYVFVRTLSASNFPILEKQLLRRMPCEICVHYFGEYAGVLERLLMSGDLRRFHTIDRSKFSSTVLEQIIQNFLEAPQSYAKDELNIEASFLSLESTEKVMEAEVQKKVCSFEEFPRCEHVDVLCRYRFAKQEAVLLVDKLSNGSWKLRTCEKGGWGDRSPSCWFPPCTASRANLERID